MGTATRMLRGIDGWLFSKPDDPSRRWHGTAEDGNPDFRIQRFGGCDFRGMTGAHTIASDVGYPRHLADRLLSRGVTVEYSNRFVAPIADLPTTAEGLRAHSKLTGDPDLVLVQVGGIHSYRTLIGVGKRRAMVRDKVARALGKRVFLAQRLANPFFCRGFRSTARGGIAELEDFIRLARSEWPEATIALLTPWALLERGGSFDPDVISALTRDTLDCAARLGVWGIDASRMLPLDPAFFCVNGAQPSVAGSIVAGVALDRWLQQTGTLPRSDTPREGVYGLKSSTHPHSAGATDDDVKVSGS